jgi:hypothetical protein
MDPRLHQASSQDNGTFRLPQALVKLLKEYFTESEDHPHRKLSFWQDIKIYADIKNILALLNPLNAQVSPHHPYVVGMVKTAAICGTGIALWHFGNRKAKIATSTDGFKHAADIVGYGKSVPN